MDAIVAQILGGFRSAIGTYEGKLDPENACAVSIVSQTDSASAISARRVASNSTSSGLFARPSRAMISSW